MRAIGSWPRSHSQSFPSVAVCQAVSTGVFLSVMICRVNVASAIGPVHQRCSDA